MEKRLNILLLSAALICPIGSFAQQNDNDGITVSGSVQADALVPTGKQDDGSNEDFRTNTYEDVNLMSKYIDAGLRFEYLDHPLPGFENGFKGHGVPYFYLRGKFNVVDVTLGSFYEQFGSGFVLRSYEERSLGIDNSLLGARVIIKPYKGIQLKAIAGRQRKYWKWNHSDITGADLELSLDQWIRALQENGHVLTLGGSIVSKHEHNDDDNIFANPTQKLNLPEDVNAYDARVNYSFKGFNVLGEYAYKTDDPSMSNGWIYRKGYVAMLSTSFSEKGFSILAQAKRSVNFDFRSDRSETGTSSHINHLPAFTQDQTYALAAMYPYATHPDGEWAYQAQIGYRFKRHTALGGRYGTSIKLNFSHVHAIDQSSHPLTLADGTVFNGAGSKGYGSAFWKWGDQTYYQDINVQLEKRITSGFKLNFMYMNQLYNKTIVEGHGGDIHSNIFVAEGLWNLSPKSRLRAEAQYLNTKDDKGDWLFGLVELSLVPHWMFTASDTYNSGTTNAHFWQLSTTYTWGAHRMQLGWGRTRSGYNCTGGVCRYVPETKGFTLSYNYNF